MEIKTQKNLAYMHNCWDDYIIYFGMPIKYFMNINFTFYDRLSLKIAHIDHPSIYLFNMQLRTNTLHDFSKYIFSIIKELIHNKCKTSAFYKSVHTSSLFFNMICKFIYHRESLKEISKISKYLWMNSFAIGILKFSYGDVNPGNFNFMKKDVKLDKLILYREHHHDYFLSPEDHSNLTPLKNMFNVINTLAKQGYMFDCENLKKNIKQIDKLSPDQYTINIKILPIKDEIIKILYGNY